MSADVTAVLVMAGGYVFSHIVREFINFGKIVDPPVETDEEIYPEVLEMAQERGIPYEEMLAGLRQAAQEWIRSLPWYTRLWLWLKQER